MVHKFPAGQLSPDDLLAADITSDGQSAGLAQSSGKYFALKDHLNSVTEFADSSGQVVQSYQYASFGKIFSIKDGAGNDITSNPRVSLSFTYTGRELDSESGMYYYRARYYDSSTGRFIQQDPDPGSLDQAITVINKYIYAGNSPLNFIDPNGELFFVIPIIAGFVGTAVGSALATYIVSAFVLTGLKAVLVGALVGAISGAIVGAAVGGSLGALEDHVVHGTLNGGMTEGMYAGAISGGVGGGVVGGTNGYFVGLRNAGYNYKVMHHGPHHNFNFIGKQPHIQLNIWKEGVKGSGKTIFRVPIPIRPPPPPPRLP